MRRRLIVFALCLSAVLPASAAITGYVMTSSGQPIAGAHVEVFALETTEATHARLLTDKPDAAPLASAQTDAKGKFALESPKEPVVMLRITAPGYAPSIERIERDEDAGAIPLTAAETKTGRITADGKPVAGAKVIFSGGELIATTDSQGRYSVPDPSKWGGAVVIQHPDYALQEINTSRLTNGGGAGRGRRAAARGAATAAAAPLDEALDTGVTLTGTVVGEDGKTPASGATILVGGWPLATSAQDGTFTIRHAPSKWETVAARSGDLIGIRARSAKSSPLVVKLAKAATFSGSIRDSKSKGPVAGADVRLWQPMRLGTVGESWNGLTDAKGNFTIAGIAAGSYQMSANRPGYAVPVLTVAVKSGEKASKSLVATPLARVSGVVVDEQKRPVAAVHVAPADVGRNFGGPMAMFMGGGARASSTAASAPDGSFAVRTDPDVDVQLVANRPGYPQAKSATLHLAPGERKSGIVLTLPNGIPLTGRVLDKDGKPLAGVTVAAVESQAYSGNVIRRVAAQMMGGRNSEDQVTTAGDGTFTVRVKEGSYDVAFKRTGYAAHLLRATHVTGSMQPLQVTLQPAVEISGRVTRNGAGVEDVRVMAIGEGADESAETGPDGSFVISDLSPGQVMLNAMKPDEFIQVMRAVTAPASDVTLEVPPGSRISGRVVDKETKQAVTAFDIGVSLARGGGGMMFSFVPAMRHMTSDDGSFVLENVPAGQTQIVVNAPGYTTARVPNVSIEEGKGVSNLEIDMDHGVRVVGHVTGPDGSPLAGASVRVAAGGGSAIRTVGPMQNNNQTVTDANGDYSIEAVESGDKTVVFAYSGLQSAQKSATLSGTETRVDAQLTSGSTVYGTVVSDTGVPVPDANVNASSAAQAFGFRSTQTDANGSFSFEGLAPGHYTFRASKSGYASGAIDDFDIATGAPVRLTLKSGGVIFGHVSGLTPDELQVAMVQASSANGGGSAAVDSTGNYRIEGAPTGTVRVTARTTMNIAGGKTSPVQSVQVDPGSPVQVDIAFKSDTVVSGRVTKNGMAVDGAVVAFTPRNAEAQTSARTTTSNGGQYQVSGLDDATYTVSVIDIQRSAPYSTTYQVHGSGTFDVDMKAAALRGHVVDTNGAPVSEAIVEVHEKADGTGMPLLNRTVQSDPSGLFAIENVQAGSYTLTASKDGYGTKSVETTVGDTDAQVDIALAQNDGVALRVVDARNGQLLMARVHVTKAGGAAVYDTPFMGGATADVIKLPLEPGTYKAQIMAMGYAAQTVTVTSPSSPTVGLTPGGTILIQSKGSGLRRARLLAGDGTAYPGHSYFTIDPAPGVTTLTNIAPGMYTLQILGDRNEVTATAPVTVADGQTASVPI